MKSFRSIVAAVALTTCASITIATGPATQAAPDIADRAAPSITVTPSTGVQPGQKVTVKGKGYPKDSSIFIVQCSSLSGNSACDLGRLLTVKTSGSGTFTAKFKVVTGKVGDGTCAKGKSCYVGAGNANANATRKFTFAK